MARRRMLQSRAADGFTLIELMIVMALIVTLASITLVQYTTAVTRSKEAVLREDLFQMRKAIDEYYADKNKYPPALQSLVDDRYLRQIPADPFTNTADTWQATTAEPDPRNPTTEIGVSDVKSGSELTAIDGSRYSEW